MPSNNAHAAIFGSGPHQRNTDSVWTSTELNSVAATTNRRNTGLEPDAGAAVAMFTVREKRVLFTDWAMI